MSLLSELLPIVIYILLIVLLIVGIIIGIKFIIDMRKVERVVDDVNVKLESLAKVFRVIDSTTDRLSMFSDSLVSILTAGVVKIIDIFKNKKKERDEEDE